MVGFMKSALNLFGISKKEDLEGGSSGSVDLDAFLSQLPQSMGFDIQFKKVEREVPGVHFEVEGPECETFLGDNCEMLDALAHLSMRVLRKNEGLANAPASEGAENFRVTFDAAGGFRDKKVQELKELATSQRQKVLDTGGKPAYIRALGPSERKVIHTTLAELGEVTSESIGRGNFKRIRIKLKDDSTFRREQPAGEESIPGEENIISADGNAAPRGNNRGGGGQRRGGRGPGGGGGGRNRRGGRGRGPGGGGNGHQARGRGGRGGNRFNDQEVNGNVQRPEETFENIDDNIGNRLRPGEEPLFPYAGGGHSAPTNFGSDDSTN